MYDEPVSRGPGPGGGPPGPPPGAGEYPELGSPGWRLVPSRPEWPDGWAGDGEDPGEDDLDLWEDPESGPPPGLDDARLAVLMAGAREVTVDGVAAAARAARSGQAGVRAVLEAVSGGRRGPGMPGSARHLPGRDASPAAGFSSGSPLDTAPGCAALGSFLEELAGPGDRYAGASDDELLGVICGWERVEASACAGKHAAAAELIRRRPAPGCALAGAARLPEGWGEFTARELGAVLGIGDGDAGAMLTLAYDLQVSLPRTNALFRAGTVTRDKAEIISRAVLFLDPAEARAAEAMVLDRAAVMTPAALRAAIKRAVMQVSPDKARKRREELAKRARVERWAEDSGNAGLAGRELPPAEVLAADQRVTAWARELRTAGLDGSMDALRARAYLDILLGTDSRPPGTRPGRTTGQDTADPGLGGPRDSAGPAGSGGPGPDNPPAPGGPSAGVIPPGFAGRVNLTIPVITLTRLAGRPGEMGGTGPIDPHLARDLAGAAARNPRSTWCVTVTDSQGHAIGHGCARPAPASRRKPHARPDQPDGSGQPGEPDGPGGPGPPGRARFTFTPAAPPGPPGGYGTWRFTTGIPGQRDLLISIGPVTTRDCDHRHEAQGHDPGVMLRHLTQIRYTTCTGPGCRRPAANCDFEHNVPYEAGGRTCLCNGNPKCRFDHRLKQDPRWTAEQLPNGDIRWTTPSGRQYLTEPTRYPI